MLTMARLRGIQGTHEDLELSQRMEHFLKTALRQKSPGYQGHCVGCRPRSPFSSLGRFLSSPSTGVPSSFIQLSAAAYWGPALDIAIHR